MKRISFTATLLAALATAVFTMSACGKTAAPENTIRLGLMQDTIAIPFCLAEDKGFFADEGINVNIQYFKSAQERDSALQAGQLDGVTSDVVSLFLLQNAGKDFRAIADSDGAYKMVGTANVGTLENMAGKKIGVSSSTIMQYSAEQILNGVGVTDYEEVNVPAIPARLEMLNAGQIDAAIMPEPFASAALQSGNVQLADIYDYGLTPGVILFDNAFITGHEAELKALFAVYDKAVDYINSTPREDYAGLIDEKVGFSTDLFLNMDLPPYAPLGAPDQANLERANAWLIEKNMVSQTFAYEDVVHPIQ